MINTPSKREEAETVIIFMGGLIPNGCVMAWQIMSVKIIRCVGFAWALLNEEVSLACSALYPI